MIEIRKATLIDLPAITAIYNEAILNTTATFDTEVKTVENRRAWFENRDENFPVIVAMQNAEIIGFASLNKWSDRKAYDITAEISIYVKADKRGKGIGKNLIEILVNMANETSLNSIIARITEGNQHSIYLHEQNGFKIIGTMKQAGNKFGKLLDVTFMQKMLR